MPVLTIPVHQTPKYSIGDKVYYGRNKKIPCFVMALTASIFEDHTQYVYDLVEQLPNESYQDLKQDYTLHYPIIQAGEDELIIILDCNR